MANGTVKWFNTNKGYGFICPDDGDKDVFVHITALEQAGLHQLNDGWQENFDVFQSYYSPHIKLLSIIS